MFENRIDAGRQLAAVLDDHGVAADVVLAIPRGGLPVARVVADRLGLPLDVVSARKIDSPGNPELAVGAVASDGTVWLNRSLIDDLGIDPGRVEEMIDSERAAAVEKVERYRGDRPPLDLDGQTVLLVDDGVATGATTTACIRRVRNAGADRVVLAAPIAPRDTVDRLRSEADEVITVENPRYFGAVGQLYQSFEQVSDDQARAYLEADEG